MTRDELIAALEVATGPSHDLDEEIMCCVYAALQLERHMEGWYTPDGTHVRVEPYTASIDAALTLVPEDTCWTISVPRQPDMSGKRYWASIRSNHPGTRGSTPAIALCIAALKARTP